MTSNNFFLVLEQFQDVRFQFQNIFSFKTCAEGEFNNDVMGNSAVSDCGHSFSHISCETTVLDVKGNKMPEGSHNFSYSK